jgi:hypothetical protein
MIRTARKRHRCDRQAYFDRLEPEKRAWYGATPCPDGGWIEIGQQYEEQEGNDVFHPSHYHPACWIAASLPWPERQAAAS